MSHTVPTRPALHPASGVAIPAPATLHAGHPARPRRRAPRVGPGSACLLIGLITALILGAHPVRGGEETPATTDGPASKAEAGGLPETVHLELQLRGAVYQRERKTEPGADEPTLFLDLRREGGHWLRGYGMAPRFNNAIHDATVLEETTDGEAMTLDLLVHYLGDAWVKGGDGRYTLTLKPSPEDGKNAYRGTFEGDFEGVAMAGPVTALRKVMPKPAADFKPIQPGEHPRLLFRKSDLPALREKAKTPFGQAALKRFETSALGLGVLYQLTGDTTYADRARAAVEVHMADNENGDKQIRCRFVGWRLEQVAMAYDLCHDAWPEDFRAEVRTYMLAVCRRMSHERGNWTEYIIWKPTAPGTSCMLYAGGLAALALHGHPGPEPQRPPAPKGLDEIPLLPADGDYTPGAGVEVMPYEDGVMGQEWLIADGLPPRSNPFADSEGGAAAFRPAVGTPLKAEEKESAFRAIPLEKDKGYLSNRYTGNQPTIDVNKASGGKFDSDNYFFGVIDNDQPRLVKLLLDHGGAEAWVAGRHLRHGAVLRLEKGLYPMLIRVHLGRVNPWALVGLRPRFQEIKKAEAEAMLARAQKAHEIAVLHWKQDHAGWKHTGGMDLRVLKAYHRATDWMRRFYREGMGEGGFQGGWSNEMAMEGPDIYATAYHNVWGVSPSPLDGVEKYVPRKLMTMVFPDATADATTDEAGDGKAGAYRTQNLIGFNGFEVRGYHEERNNAGNVLAGFFPMIDPKAKPTALWFWKRKKGLAADADPTPLLNTHTRPMIHRLIDAGKGPGTGYDVDAVYAFVNLPLETEAKPPAETLPLTWTAPEHGYYILRDRWKDGEDFVTQFYGQTRPTTPTRGDKAGAYSIVGLGETWTTGNDVEMRGMGDRTGENVVQLLRGQYNDSGLGRITHEDIAEDGSTASITVDLADVYTPLRIRSKKVTKKKKAKVVQIKYDEPYDKLGNVRRDSAFDKENRRTGLRAFAVDYSGKSGAPCLVALVDRVGNYEDPVWTWQIGDLTQALGSDAKVEIDASKDWAREPLPETMPVWTESGITIETDGFRIDKAGGKTLRATFVTPKPVTVKAEMLTKTVKVPKNIHKKGRAVLSVAGGQAFFVVMTIQKGEAPKVVAEGEGLDAVVTVGERKVRFDGEKILFE